jgi:hypothetical protein
MDLLIGDVSDPRTRCAWLGKHFFTIIQKQFEKCNGLIEERGTFVSQSAGDIYLLRSGKGARIPREVGVGGV